MKTFAVITMISAWACIWLGRDWGEGLKLLRFIVFLLLGAVFTLAGGFSYWWDSGMRPDQKSATIMVCGILILLSQADGLIRAMFDEVDPDDYPRRKDRR